jgi:hypothetical protein
MEAIATIQAIRTGWVHPTINHVSCVRWCDGRWHGFLSASCRTMNSRI